MKRRATTKLRMRTGNGARASPDFVRMGRMSGNGRRMRAKRREEDEVVEFGEARAERHCPKKVSGASPCSDHNHAVPQSGEARAPLPVHSNICVAAS